MSLDFRVCVNGECVCADVSCAESGECIEGVQKVTNLFSVPALFPQFVECFVSVYGHVHAFTGCRNTCYTDVFCATLGSELDVWFVVGGRSRDGCFHRPLFCGQDCVHMDTRECVYFVKCD